MDHHHNDALVPTSSAPLVPPLPTPAHVCCHRRAASVAQKPLGGITKLKRRYSRSLDHRPATPALASCHATVSSPPSSTPSLVFAAPTSSPSCSIGSSVSAPSGGVVGSSLLSISSSSSSSSSSFDLYSTIPLEPKAPRKIRHTKTLPNLSRPSKARRSLQFSTLPNMSNHSAK